MISTFDYIQGRNYAPNFYLDPGFARLKERQLLDYCKSVTTWYRAMISFCSNLICISVLANFHTVKNKQPKIICLLLVINKLHLIFNELNFYSILLS